MRKKENRCYTIGELAQKAGITVRTLQYYDKTGLLNSTISESGRRTYTDADVLRLQQILFLKTFGFSLEQIRTGVMNAQSADELETMFGRQKELLQREMENLEQILGMLDTVIFDLKKGNDMNMERLMSMMYLMRQGNPYAFVLGYFPSDQIRQISERYETPEKQKIADRFTQNAQNIFSELNVLYEQGEDPGSEKGQELAAKWWGMVAEFTQGDEQLLRTLISAGTDIGEWPSETNAFRGAVEHFLGKALAIYLESKNIKLPITEEQ